MNTKLILYTVMLALFIFPNFLFTAFSINEGFNTWVGLVQLLSLITLIMGLIIVYKTAHKTEKSSPPEQTNDEIFDPLIRDTLQRIKVRVSEITQISNALHERLEMLNNVSGDILRGASIQTDNVVKSTDTMVDVSGGIQQIASSAEVVSNTSKKASDAANEGFQLIGNMLSQMQSIQQIVERLSEVIKDLASHSSEINQIVNTITDIDEETNLLSLNANIEAARAGEYGKGFAVVAKEVGKLSNKSKTATEHISDILSSIQTKVETAVEMATRSIEKVSEGARAMNTTKSYFETIKQEVSGTSDQVMEMSAAIEQLSAGTEEVNKITEFTMKVQQGGTSKIKQLDMLLKEFQSTFEEIANKCADLEVNIEYTPTRSEGNEQ